MDVQRYGMARVLSVEYPLRYSDGPFEVMGLEDLERRLLAVNEFVLDGYSDAGEGVKVRYLKELQVRKFVDLVWVSKTETHARSFLFCFFTLCSRTSLSSFARRFAHHHADVNGRSNIILKALHMSLY